MIELPTHRVTIEQFAETDTNVSDGMGGTTVQKDWQTVKDQIPARFYDARTPGAEIDEYGELFIDRSRISVNPRYVGTVTDGQYHLDIGRGSDWRVTIHGIREENRRYQIDEINERYGLDRLPANILMYVEVLS